MIPEEVLQLGVDILCKECEIIFHQPTIEEIGIIGGEEKLFLGGGMLNFSKDILSNEDKINLANTSDFEILMSMLGDKENQEAETIQYALIILSLLLPRYKIKITNNGIMLLDRDDEKVPPHFITEKNFNIFKEYIKDILCLDYYKSKDTDYNPAGAKSSYIANKLKEGKAKAAKSKGQDNNKDSLFSRYISILSVGLQKDKNELKKYTIFQLFDEFKRYELKLANDMYWQAKVAGATGMKEVDNWMENLYP